MYTFYCNENNAQFYNALENGETFTNLEDCKKAALAKIENRSTQWATIDFDGEEIFEERIKTVK
jgi:hypothetical protein